MNIRKVMKLLSDFNKPDAIIGTKWGDYTKVRAVFSKKGHFDFVNPSHTAMMRIYDPVIFNLICGMYDPATLKISLKAHFPKMKYPKGKAKSKFSTEFIILISQMADITESSEIIISVGDDYPITVEISEPKIKLCIAPRVDNY